MSTTTQKHVSMKDLYNHPVNAERLAAWAKDRQQLRRDPRTPVISATGEILEGFASLVVAFERGDSWITVAVKE